MGGRYLARPMIGIIPTSSGRGYWMVAEDGGVFAFGDAGFLGSLGGRPISAPIVALAATRTNNGYWLLGHNGAVYAFGDAAYLGRDEFVTGLATDIAALADGTGYVTLDETGRGVDPSVGRGAGRGTGRQPARRRAGGRARAGRERRGIVGRVVGRGAVARLGLRPGIVPPARRRALEPVPRRRVEVRSAQHAAERARALRGAVRLRRAAARGSFTTAGPPATRTSRPTRSSRAGGTSPARAIPRAASCSAPRSRNRRTARVSGSRATTST